MQKMKTVLKSERGLFDLPSIMAGVIIIGLLAALTTASVLLVIPWFQGNTAKDTLNIIKVAETSARQASGSYQDYSTLVSNDFMAKVSDPTCITLDSGNKGYTAYTKTVAGKVFQLSSTTEAIIPWNQAVPCTLS
jgi:hypothetical protein